MDMASHNGLNTGNSSASEALDSIQEISSQFFEMVPVRKLKWKDEDAAILASNQNLQRDLLAATVNSAVCLKCPPALSYMRYFMKMLIHKLEAEDADICDEMYEVYTEILSQKEDEDDTLCYKTYTLPQGIQISLLESVHLVSEGTTGLCTWQAAQHLAEWILENPKMFSNKSVLELGSGLGLTGLTCLTREPRHYTFTDCHRQVLSLLARNIEQTLCQVDISDSKSLPKSSYQSKRFESDSTVFDEIRSDPVELDLNLSNWDVGACGRLARLKVDSRVSIAHLDWECVKTRHLNALRSDIIIAADVVYDNSIIPALVFVLKSLLVPSTSCDTKPQAFIASTVRNEDTRDEFLIAMGAEGLKYTVVESPTLNQFYYDRSVPIEILHVVAS